MSLSPCVRRPMSALVFRKQPRCRALYIVVITALVVALVQMLPIAVSSVATRALASPVTGTGGLFVPVQGRLIDTRSASHIGPYSTPMAPSAWRSVAVDGVPDVPSSGVGAVQVAVSGFANGNGASTLDLSESLATPKPETVLNFGGATNSNTAIVAVGSDGKIMFRTSTASDVIIDVQGYYTAGDPAEGGFTPVTPKRIVQSSTNLGVQGPLAALSTHTISISSSVAPQGASAVFVNVAITASGSNGYAVAYPSDASSRPTVGMDYPGAGVTTSFGTTVPLAADGTFKIFVSTGPDDIAVDISGYFDAAVSDGAFTPAQASIANNASIASGATATILVSGVNGTPAIGSGVSSIAVNLQATTSQTSGARITAYPTSLSTAPNTTSLSIPSGTSGSTSNFTTVQTGTDGKVKFYNHGPDDITLTVSVEGWYTNVGLPITNGQFQTQQSVTLQADPKPVADYVSYWYRAGTTADLAQLQPSSLTDGDGQHPASAVIQKTGTTFPAYTWNIANTLAAVNGGVAPDTLVQVEACYRSDPNAAGSCGALVNIDFAQSAFGLGYATSNVGPGTLSEVTGDFEVDASDADESAPLGDLSVGRSLTTLVPIDAGVAAVSQRTDASGVFGPGWTADLTSGGDGDLTITDHPSDGYMVFNGTDGASQKYEQASDPTTYPVHYEGVDTAATLGVLVAKTDAAHITMTEPDKTVTTWTKSGSAWHVTSVKQNGSNSSTTYTYTAAGLPTRILAPVPVGVSCTSPDNTPGCRSLILTYESLSVGTATVTRLKQISLSAPQSASDTPVSVEAFDYTLTGWLADAYDPRITPNLKTSYTYNGGGRLDSLTPPGQAGWHLTYDSIGRLSTSYRQDPSGPNATSTVIYGLPLSGPGLPDVTSTTAGHWDQTTDLAVTGTATFPPDHQLAGTTLGAVASNDWPYASIDYYDVNGQVVNSAAFGAGDWQINTNQYDDDGNDVWDLTAGNRVQALTPTASTDTFVAGLSSNVDRANLLASTTTYDPQNPWIATETEGPTHPVTLSDGTLVHARDHVIIKYDDGAPSDNDSDGFGDPYGLPTSGTSSEFDVATGADTTYPDVSITRYGYDPIDGSSSTGPTSGWMLGEATTSTVQMGANQDDQTDLTTQTRYDSEGRVLEQRLPGDGSGKTPRTTLTTYYVAGSGGACANSAEAGLVCAVGPAAQPATGKPLATTTYSYNQYGDTLTAVESYGTSGTSRTSTNTYDGADRLSTTSVAVSPTSAGGAALPTVTYGYDPSSGLPTTQQTGPAPNYATITTGYDTLGRPASYTDANGATSTTGYDLDSRPITVNDGKGTYSYTYDGTSSEHRGLLTSENVGVSGQPSTFSAAYDAAGNLATETYPNGLVATTTFDNIGNTTSLTYAQSGTTWMSFTATRGVGGRIVAQSSPQSSQSFGYDAAGRLTTVQDTLGSSCSTRTYTFDTNSNRTDLYSYPAASGGACSTSTTPTHRHSAFDQADRITDPGYVYDGLGRTTTVPAADAAGSGSHAATTGDLSIGYYANDLVASQSQGDQTQTYTLDPRQNRDASVTSPSGATTINHYTNDGDAPAWAATGANWTRNLVGINGGLGGTVDQSGTITLDYTNLHTDVVATSGDDQSATGVTTYQEATEYGQPRSGSQSYAAYGWLGGDQRSSDALGGLILMGSRLYNPATGRFLSVDPVQSGNANSYVYPTDPLNYGDMSGCSNTPMPGDTGGNGTGIPIHPRRHRFDSHWHIELDGFKFTCSDWICRTTVLNVYNAAWRLFNWFTYNGSLPMVLNSRYRGIQLRGRGRWGPGLYGIGQSAKYQETVDLNVVRSDGERWIIKFHFNTQKLYDEPIGPPAGPIIVG